MNEDKQISSLLKPDELSGEPKRISEAIVKAQRQVGLIDISSLFIAKIWSVLAVLIAPICVGCTRYLDQQASKNQSKEE